MSTVTLFDVGLILVILAAALGGSRLGLVTRAWSWLGLGVGLVVATRLAGPVVDLVDDRDAYVRLVVALAIVVICVGVGQSIGFAIGDRLRRTLPDSLVSVDRVAGAVTGVLVVLAVVWLLLPTLTMMQGTPARLARGSAIVAALDRYSPPVPPSVRDLGQQVSDFGFPEVFDDLRAAPEVGPPPASLGLPVEVVDRVTPSTMNIEARGCGGIYEGSGFVVEAELVATNAHVVAGSESLEVVLDGGGSRLAAELVAIDTGSDLALLRVPGLSRRPLPLGTAEDGTEAAVFGHPGGQDELRIAPAVVADHQVALGRDIYNRDPASREVLILAAEVRQGDSGSAVVDPSGQVVGVLFAVAPDRPATAYALDVGELRRLLDDPRDPSTPSGACS
jgi:S1-C subfamily serine protease